MTKETIMDTYAIEQGYLNYEHLIDRIIDNNSLELARDLILEHQNAVTDLIQEELKKNIHNELNGVYFNNLDDLKDCRKEILNTEIL